MISNIPLSITELQTSLNKKEFSCVELVDSYFERIDKLNPDLNAYLTLSKDEAYKKAKENDKRIIDLKEDAFKENPLLGVCIGYKDNYLTKGIRTTAASKVLESYIPAYSATVVKKLDKAGCIMLGKLNMDAWAHGSSGEYSDFGPAKNPWNREYVPGGSSSGSGVALASNMAMVTTGTDTCGSIRLPANYCGKVGFKPTYGSVSRYGIIAMASSLDSVGHLTHTVADSEKIFNVTRGVDNFDATLKETEEVSIKPKLRIGIPKEFFVEGLDPEVKQVVTSAVEVFKKLGMEVVEVSLPNTKYGISVYYIIQPAEVSSNLGRYDGIRYGDNRNKFGDEAKRRIMLGTHVLSAGYYDAYYLKAMKVRSKIIQEVEEAFSKVDVLIAPVAPSAPFKFGEKVSDPLKMYLTDVLAATANLSGIPSLAIPHGFNQKGLPLGFQLMAPRFSEKLLFELGKLFEKKTNFEPGIVK
jgi:aspartyl-tRNA(Asn)/glutamyl-tRNA(Gln) amidotransferase subunit A